MTGSICRESFGSYFFCQGVPFQLLVVVEAPPFAESALVDGQLDLLAGCAGECGVGFGSEVAFTVSMEEGDVAD